MSTDLHDRFGDAVPRPTLDDAHLARLLARGVRRRRRRTIGLVAAAVVSVVGGVAAAPALIGGGATVPVVGDRPADVSPFEFPDPAPQGLVESSAGRLELPVDAPVWGGSAPIRLEVDHPHDAAVAVDADGAIAWAGRGPLRVLEHGEVGPPGGETLPLQVRRNDARVWRRTRLLHFDDTGLWSVREVHHGVEYAGHVGFSSAGEASLPSYQGQPLLLVDGDDRQLAVVRSGQGPTAVPLTPDTIAQDPVPLGGPLPPAPLPTGRDGAVRPRKPFGPYAEWRGLSEELVVLDYADEGPDIGVWLSYIGGQPVFARIPSLGQGGPATARLTASRTVVDGRTAAVLDHGEGEGRLMALLVVDGDGSGAVMLLDLAIQPDGLVSVEPVIGADGAVYLVRRTEAALELRAVLDPHLDPASGG